MSKAKKFDDLVTGKGNGLVMLLHGSPGTGKSLTAERFDSHSFLALPKLTLLSSLV
jgi:predicted ATPase with chaperone activity